MTRRLYLHIGHAKTGSSYLQSTLARSQGALANLGFHYPSARNFEVAQAGHMTDGNSAEWVEAFLANDPAKLPVQSGDQSATLISGEHLFGIMNEPDAAQRVQAMMSQHGFDRAELLLIIRDPMEHLVSEFSQRVKGGHNVTLPRMARNYDRPGGVLKVIQNFADVTSINLTIMNYRRVKTDIVAAFADWLGCPAAHFVQPEQAVVNRALSMDELMLQRALNKRLGWCRGVIADPLTKALPSFRGRAPMLRRKAARAFIKTQAPTIRAVNAHLPKHDHYRLPSRLSLWSPRRILEGFRADGVYFTDEQLRVIVDGFADEIEKRRHDGRKE